MDNLLELAKANQLEKIIEYIKNIRSNIKKIETISSLPDNIKLELINKSADIYIEPKYAENFDIKTRENLRTAFAFSLINTLSEENILKFLINKDDRFKVDFVLNTVQNDSRKLKIINSISDFPYKLLIAQKLDNRDLKIDTLLNLGVPKIYVAMTEKDYQTDLLNSSENQKYNSVGLSDKLTFGIEIEGANINYAETLKKTNKLNIHWQCKGDYTILDGSEKYKDINFGLEVVSPILNDNEESVQQIYTTCNMLQQLGTTTNPKCGGHIHFGIDYFKNPKELWNLIEIYGNCEEIFNLICNEPGTLPRDSLNRFATPTYKKLLEANINPDNFSNMDDFRKEIGAIQAGKDYDINISIHHTVEFRTPNSSMNPNIWIENIKLFGKLMEVSKALEDNSLDNTNKKRNLFSQLKSQTDTSQKCNLLLDLLFDDEKDKEIFQNRFELNRNLQIKMEDYRELYLSQENNLSIDSTQHSKEEI